MSEEIYIRKCYVGYSKQSEIRMSSTSGGICQEISRCVILQGGVVSGVWFDNDFNVVRGIAENIDELKKVNKSKYVQAKQGNAYSEIKTILDSGRVVLFVGTPCQVAGLKSFLRKTYENLYCIDFVCLGVPSAKAWQLYRDELREGNRLLEIDYKNKRNGWYNFSFYALFDNMNEYIEAGRKNLYMCAMIRKLCNRPSCYNCKFRTLQRNSDITVADAWGTEKIAKELLDDKGTSAIMINSKRGEALLQKVKAECILKEVSPKDLWKGNTSAFIQYKKPYGRYIFYKVISKYGFVRGSKRLMK